TRLNPFWSTLAPELELCTNLAENSMRPIAVGRANWIHIGSEQAGPPSSRLWKVVDGSRSQLASITAYVVAMKGGTSRALRADVHLPHKSSTGPELNLC
ncbi:MAG: transposase, partial [Candidatus Acidiferrum sp.]